VSDCVIVSGSRSWQPAVPVWRVLDKYDPQIVVHGGAVGVDTIAHRWCKTHGRVAVVFFPNYHDYDGHEAPKKRNLQMLDLYPKAPVLAFPFPDSRGTRHVIAEAHRRGMAVEVTEWRDLA
jgi:hypothetical protein